ncbi:MAG: EAL domain-containing protein [Betaproteobacteria bacterium]|nr:EAL domain-containing protein [Betaproteobacteria bacterium]
MDHGETAGIALEAELREAVRLQQFELHYQPQVRIANREVVGMEALIRWAHPTRGLLLPAAFIPAAERNGLIVPIAEWVLRTACAQTRAWHQAGLPTLTVAVNLSALQFRQTGFVKLVSGILKSTGLDPCFLDLEVTKSLVMGAPETMMARFNELRELGIVLSIDDFGTGYANFGHFMNFPLDQLKIDPAFVHGLPACVESAAIARAIVSMGSSLGVRVMAVGVENRHQADFLRSIWCEYAQGYYYCMPLPAGEFQAWARNAAGDADADARETDREFMLAA